jgi:hypothetical protein
MIVRTDDSSDEQRTCTGGLVGTTRSAKDGGGQRAGHEWKCPWSSERMPAPATSRSIVVISYKLRKFISYKLSPPRPPSV